MKRIVFSLFVMMCLLVSCSDDDLQHMSQLPDSSTEISIYNKAGDAIAYFSKEGEEQVIYLWNGKPTAYVVEGKAIYGFNGKFIGWKESGIIYNADGQIIGFECGALNVITNAESDKSSKEALPVKSIRKNMPEKPVVTSVWSLESLDEVLYRGVL